MKFLVIGCNGMAGHMISLYLKEQGHHVTGFARQASRFVDTVDVREKYLLYDNKICTGEEAAEGLWKMKRRMNQIGYQVVTDRGDYK